MKIRYTITRFDLLRANLQAIICNRFLWGVWSILVIFVSYSLITDGKYDDKAAGYRITMIVVLALLDFVVMFGLAAVMMLITVLARKHIGVLGEHTLSIEEDGLVEETVHNVSRNRWSSYQKTRIRGGFAFLYVSEALFHLIPLRRPLLEGDMQGFLKALNEKTNRA